MKLKDIFNNKTDEYGMEQALEQIREGRDFAVECGYDIEQLHCKGCIYTCPLSRAKCETGKAAAEVFKGLK